MRMLMKVQMDTPTSNEAIKAGTLRKTVEGALEKLRPEAAYFTVEDGCRTAYLFFDLADPADMPGLSQPFFVGLNAKVHYSPVMSPEDLGRGLAALASESE